MGLDNMKVRGFKAGAVAAGLKKDGKTDLAIIFSEHEAVAAAAFTTNRVKAAPVLVSQENIRDGKVRAILANAGNANACTGERGMADARECARLAAESLKISEDEVLVASTGVIGEPLRMELLKKAIPGLASSLSPDGFPEVAKALMTTDSFPKESMYLGEAEGKTYLIRGMAKGAGMIMPNMATMLSFILTDLAIDHDRLDRALKSSVKTTFNRITVDGDTSTNDMVIVLANGEAGNETLSEADYAAFSKGLERVMEDLARMIVRDGEGASCTFQVNVTNAASASEAERAARVVANSCLVKTAVCGRDPNWGRIMAALGRSDIVFDERDVDIFIDEVRIVKGGLAEGGDAEKEASGRMKKNDFVLRIDLKKGEFQDRIYTCDLTHDYITINADYRS